jgi:hypothetical protein
VGAGRGSPTANGGVCVAVSSMQRRQHDNLHAETMARQRALYGCCAGSGGAREWMVGLRFRRASREIVGKVVVVDAATREVVAEGRRQREMGGSGGVEDTHDHDQTVGPLGLTRPRRGERGVTAGPRSS